MVPPKHWDWDQLLRIAGAVLAIVFFGVLLALLGGAIMVRLVFETLTSYGQ